MSFYHQKLPEILRYLHNKMNPSDKIAFEAEMKENIILKQEVEFDALMLKMLEKERHENFKALLIQKVAAEKAEKTIPLWGNKYYAAIAASAAILLIVLIFSLWKEKPAINERDISLNPPKDTNAPVVEQKKEREVIEKNLPLDSVINPKTIVRNDSKTAQPNKKLRNWLEYSTRASYVNPTLNPLVSNSDAEDIIAISDSLIGQRKYQEALELLNKSEDKSTDADIWYLIGECYFYTQDFTNASLFFHKVLPLGGRNAGRARWYIALMYAQNNQNKLALRQLDTFFLYKTILSKQDTVYLQKAEKLKMEIQK